MHQFGKGHPGVSSCRAIDETVLLSHLLQPCQCSNAAGSAMPPLYAPQLEWCICQQGACIAADGVLVSPILASGLDGCALQIAKPLLVLQDR